MSPFWPELVFDITAVLTVAGMAVTLLQYRRLQRNLTAQLEIVSRQWEQLIECRERR